MEIRFIKEYRALLDDNTCRTYRAGQTWSVNITVAQWLIDNGFAEKVEGTKGGWKPKDGDIYYVAYPDGLIASCTWDGCTVDLNRFLNGAVFKTKEATRRWRDYLKAVETVRHDEGFMKRERERDNAVYPIIKNSALGATSTAAAFGQHAGEFYFDTREHALNSAMNHTREWQTILNYDWSRE